MSSYKYNPVTAPLQRQYDTFSDIEMEIDEGTNLAGSNKWLGSTRAKNGKVYHTPNSATDILVIDEKTNETYRTDFGTTIPSGALKFSKPVDGLEKVYALPNESSSHLEIEYNDTISITEHDTITTKNNTAQLVFNGDFLIGFAGWIVSGASVRDNGLGLELFSRSSYFNARQDISLSNMNRQLIDLGLVKYDASWFQRGFSGDSDRGKFTINFLDETDVIITADTLGYIARSTNPIYSNMDGFIPANTHSIQIFFEGSRRAGTVNNGHGGDFSIIASAEQSDIDTYGELFSSGTIRDISGTRVAEAWDSESLSKYIIGAPRTGSYFYILDTSTNELTAQSYTADTLNKEAYLTIKKYNNTLYSIPYSASSVLKMHIENDEVKSEQVDFGLDLSGTNKWLGAVVHDGKIYCCPYNATQVLVIDTENETAQLTDFGLDMSGNSKWNDGAVGKDGKIYMYPATSDKILVIDPDNNTADFMSTDVNLSGVDKYSGGIGMVSSNGHLYASPSDASDILMIDTDPTSKDYQKAYRNTCFHNLGGGGSTSAVKYWGGVIAPNGKIFANIYQTNTNSALIIDTIKNISYRKDYGFTISYTGTAYGGIALGTDGNIYCIPRDANNVLIINPETEEARTENYGLSFGGDSFFGAVSTGNKVYGIPQNKNEVLVIDIVTQTAEYKDYGLGLSGNDKFRGGTLGTDGKIYCAPFNSRNILVIDPVTESAFLTAMGADLSASEKYVNSFLGSQGEVIFVPYESGEFLTIDTENQIAVSETFDGDSLGNSRIGVNFSANGKFYTAPSADRYVYEIDTNNKTVKRTTDFVDSSFNGKRIGAVVDNNGTVYMMAGRMPNILRVRPKKKYNMTMNPELALSPYYNKF